MAIVLHQFPISHYCEKVRWALEFKKLDYKTVNMIPGLHLKQTKKMGVKSSVPIIEHRGNFIQGSNTIIDYLDQTFPEKPLTPVENNQQQKIAEWEDQLSAEIGVPIRLCLYHILLQHPKIVKPFFAHNGPWYGRLFLSFAYPKLVSKMRYFMKINSETAIESKQVLSKTIDKLNEHYKENEFLVGDRFTRADLSAAALLAPLSMQAKNGLDS